MNTAITQKSQEIVFALIRISAYIRRFEMRKTIERLSYHLLENVSFQNPEMTLGSISALRNFVVLGKNTYEIEGLNAKILDRELEYLENEVRRFAGISGQAGIENLFTKQIEIKKTDSVKFSRRDKKQDQGMRQSIPEEVLVADEEIGNSAIEFGNEEGSNDDNTAILRRAKIHAMLSTAPEYRLSLREIVAAFPGVSERTVRYDLKALAESGRIIRQGSGGPSSYYQAVREGSGGVINL